MPTTRPRHQVTETPTVADAIDLAARQWPGERRSRLLLRLVEVGREALERRDAVEAGERQAAVARTSGKYAEAFDAGYLAELRRDWPG